jgi:predicted GNAT superfamily acetyltransferase
MKRMIELAVIATELERRGLAGLAERVDRLVTAAPKMILKNPSYMESEDKRFRAWLDALIGGRIEHGWTITDTHRKDSSGTSWVVARGKSRSGVDAAIERYLRVGPLGIHPFQDD